MNMNDHCRCKQCNVRSLAIEGLSAHLFNLFALYHCGQALNDVSDEIRL